MSDQIIGTPVSFPGAEMPPNFNQNFLGIAGSLLAAFDVPRRGRQLPSHCFASKPLKRKIVMFLVDGLGYDAFVKAVPRSLTDGKDPVLSALTTQFPSTTAAIIPSFMSAKSVGESGVYEWIQMNRKVGQLFRPLPFTFVDYEGEDKVSLVPEFGAEDVFPKNRLSRQLASKGVRSFYYLPAHVKGPANDHFGVAASTRSYKSHDHLLQEMLGGLELHDRSFLYAYLPEVDTVGHTHGPSSEHYKAAAAKTLESVATIADALMKADPSVQVWITADHGQIDIDLQGEGLILLDREAPELLSMFEHDRNGKPILPAGGLRDCFLHVREEERETALNLLKERLSSRAAVYTSSELIKKGVFASPSAQLRHNVGDIVILPLENRCVHWSGHLDSRLKFKGDHGGMSTEEMEIPFLVL